MGSLAERLVDWVGQVIVVDLASPFVAIGALKETAPDFLELADADLHDLRDTETSRELYVVKTKRHGLAANRRTVVLRMAEVVGVSRLEDVVAG